MAANLLIFIIGPSVTQVVAMETGTGRDQVKDLTKLYLSAHIFCVEQHADGETISRCRLLVTRPAAADSISFILNGCSCPKSENGRHKEQLESNHLAILRLRDNNRNNHVWSSAPSNQNV
jgi:hypothetical protein